MARPLFAATQVHIALVFGHVRQAVITPLKRHPLYDELPSLDEATTRVDALVSDDPIDSNIREPPGVLDGFSGPGSVTPAIPPGLFTSVHASPAASLASLHAGSRGRQTPIAFPILPPKDSAAAVASSATPSKKAGAQPGQDAKKNIKALAIESGLSKDIASQASKVKAQKVLQEEDFPALHASKPTASTAPSPKVSTKSAPSTKQGSTSTKKTAEKDKSAAKPAEKQEKVTDKATGKPADRSSVKAPEKVTTGNSAAGTNASAKQFREAGKKPMPGILNIAAAMKVAQTKLSEATSSAATDKAITDKEAFPALPTPGTASVSSPLTRTAPKTLRVVPTPKTEVPLTPSGLSSAGSAAMRTAAAAIAGRPDTPASEIISDSASIISASISASRTNSPPPSKVGSAPVRTTTKSQQRKQRKEASKREADVIVPKVEPEVDIAPILGRKKKQRKEKEKDKGKDKIASSNVTPTASRPETPIAQAPPVATPAKEVKEVKETREETSTYRSTANETTNVLDDKTSPRIDVKGKNMEGGAAAGESASSSTPKTLPTPYSAFQELLMEKLIGAVDDLALLRPVNSQGDKLRPETSGALSKETLSGQDPLNRDLLSTKSIITEEEQRALLAGKSVRKTVDGVRILLTPNFDCVRNLTEEEEDRFLELQRRIGESLNEPAMFASARHESAGGFSLIKGRAVPNGPPAYFPQMPGFLAEPINKIQREEAIYYINQYVLPRLNLGNSPVAGVSPGAWKSAFPDGKVNLHATAASLNSIAPWIYGNGHGAGPAPHDSPDTAAPELNYPGPIGSLSDPTMFELAGPSGPMRVSASLDTTPSAASLDAALPNPLPNPPVTAPVPAYPGKLSTSVGGGPTTTPGPFGSVPLMSLEDAESALSVARKETEKLEKSLNQVIKKNRRLLLGNH